MIQNQSTKTLVLALGFVATVTALISSFFFPHLPVVWQSSGVVALILLVAYAVLDRKRFSNTLSQRNTKYGLNAVLISLVVLAITVFLNLIAKEYDWKKDFTRNQTNSLAEQSKKIVRDLKQDVVIKAFLNSNAKPQYAEFLKRYAYESKKLKLEFVDVERDPVLTRQYKIKPGGAIVVESANRTSRVENLTGPDDTKLEEKVTNAIIEVVKGSKKTIYFTSGHGERLPTNTEQDGLSSIKETLSAGRYDVKEVVLFQQEKVPQDAEILIMAGPRTEMMANELKMISEYLKAGGKMLMLLEPESPAALKSVLNPYGIDVKFKKTIYEANPVQRLLGVDSPLVPVVLRYDPTSEIVRSIQQPTLFPIPVPVEKSAQAPEGLTVTSLFSTSENSYEVEFAPGKNLKIDKSNKRGPLSLAISVEAKDETPPAMPGSKEEAPKEKKKGVRLIVVGDSDFITNGPIRFGMNADLFQNMLSWLAEEEDLISIRPKATDTQSFDLTESRGRIVSFVSVLLLPFIFLATGVSTWYTRRRR